MASIPLLCNICPKHPDFSDISHLLTHVGSKGHLSHYFKAQVRSRQEPSIRQQLDVYDRWYAQHQIEKLLSQRMALKELKDTKSRSRGTRKNVLSRTDPTTLPEKSVKSQTATPKQLLDTETDVNLNSPIDPQLSQTPRVSATETSQSPVLDFPSRELASQHRSYAPQMQREANTDFPRDVSPDLLLRSELHHVHRKKEEDACSNSVSPEIRFQSLKKTIYPWPTAFSGLPHVQTPQQGPHRTDPPLHSPPVEDWGRGIHVPDEVGSVLSPILKGVQWPGMNIFDSASPEAQRKRNQKKKSSIMAQMELNSTAVEPIERIYWPEGGLKKERVITGMVESSPIKDDSPRPKRRRLAPPRVVLGDLSTNEPRKAGRMRNKNRRDSTSQDADLGDLSKRALAMLDPATYTSLPSTRPGLGTVDEEDVEWRLNAGESSPGRGHDFIIFEDDAENERRASAQARNLATKSTDYRSISSAYLDSQAAVSYDLSNFSFDPAFAHPESYLSSCNNLSGQTTTLPTTPAQWLHHSAGNPCLISRMGKENLEPLSGYERRIDSELSPTRPERSTQRYFSVRDDHPPEFFDYMPPEMEFASLVDPRYFGASPNPLNSNAHLQRSQLFHHQNSQGLRVSEPCEPKRMKPLLR